MSRMQRKPEWTISLMYFGISMIWILFSDMLLFDYLEPHVSVQTLSTIKGWLFVSVTALLLLLFLRRIFSSYRGREREREEVLKQLRMHTDRMPIGYIVTDSDFRFRYLNPAAERMFGFSTHELRGKKPYGRIIPESARPFVEGVRKSWIEGNPEPHGRNQNLTSDGRTIICDWFNTPIFDQNGNFDHLISMVQDVTELERAIDALRESEERYRALMEDLPALVCEFTTDSTLTYVNRAYAEYFETTPDQLIGKRFLDFLSEEAAEEVRNTYMSLTPAKPSYTYTHSVQIKDEEAVHQWTDHAFFDEEGNILRFQAVGFDLTERVRMEQGLEEREEQLRLLVENQTDVLVKVDPEGRFEYVSPSYCRLFGKSQDELIGRSFVPLVHEDDLQQTMEVMDALYHPPHSASVQQRAMTVFGWRWLEWVDTAVLNEDGKVESIIGVGRDITERKRAEEALRASEERYRVLIERANDGILLINDGVFVSCNQSAAQILHCEPEDIEGHRPEDISPPRQPDGMASDEKARKLMEESTVGGSRVFEWIHLRRNGEPAVIEVSLSRVEIGDQPMLLCFWRDITQRKKAEQEIADSRERLRALAERLDEVREEERLHLSREIHDGLGQSLTALKIDMSLLRRILHSSIGGEGSEQRDDEQQEAEEALASMESLLRQTIDQVRQIAWEMRPVMLDQLGLPDALRQYVRDIAERSGLELQEDIVDLPVMPSNRTSLALYRIVQEALTNIVRHARARQVRIRLQNRERNLRLEVVDDGVGIPAEPSGAPGIGLNSMRERAEALGGTCVIESPTEGRGTRIVVEVPN